MQESLRNSPGTGSWLNTICIVCGLVSFGTNPTVNWLLPFGLTSVMGCVVTPWTSTVKVPSPASEQSTEKARQNCVKVNCRSQK